MNRWTLTSGASPSFIFGPSLRLRKCMLWATPFYIALDPVPEQMPIMRQVLGLYIFMFSGPWIWDWLRILTVAVLLESG